MAPAARPEGEPGGNPVKQAQLKGFGSPPEVVDCIEGPDCGPPGPGEVRVGIAYSAINPADLLIIEGRYATRPELRTPNTWKRSCLAGSVIR